MRSSRSISAMVCSVSIRLNIQHKRGNGQTGRHQCRFCEGAPHAVEELIGVHGYDIKAAMHVIRLLNEGIELMRSGTITLPRPERKLLITIRTGNYGSLERVLSLANSLFRELEEAEAKSGLPEKVDRNRISALVSDTYLRFWNNPLAAPGCQP
jgi:RNA repair pathway DNA polymerase beta family